MFACRRKYSEVGIVQDPRARGTTRSGSHGSRPTLTFWQMWTPREGTNWGLLGVFGGAFSEREPGLALVPVSLQLANLGTDVRMQAGRLSLINPLERDAIGRELKRPVDADSLHTGFVGSPGGHIGA